MPGKQKFYIYKAWKEDKISLLLTTKNWKQCLMLYHFWNIEYIHFQRQSRLPIRLQPLWNLVDVNILYIFAHFGQFNWNKLLHQTNLESNIPCSCSIQAQNSYSNQSYLGRSQHLISLTLFLMPLITASALANHHNFHQFVPGNNNCFFNTY